MGNNSTKEARDDGRGLRSSAGLDAGHSRLVAPASHDGLGRHRGRGSRTDLSGLLGISASTSQAVPGSSGPSERRETKQEREARRLERERLARITERERSMREEHVDGGYLVTLGVYVGVEDFNKAVVRQLQIERRLAPFWRGLQEVSGTWTEYQLICAARGLPVPPADAVPPEDFLARPNPISLADPSIKPAPSHSHNTLTVPGMPQASPTSLSGASENPSGAVPVGALAGTSAPNLPQASASTAPGSSRGGSNSPFKPRAKALAAALSVSSRNGSSTDIAPREIQLPHDPFVNGQPIEVVLYKEAIDCPICFLSYPPYLNHTRCCDQPICSECFVQIKRTEPHYPEGHGDDGGNGDNVHPEEQAGQLISEPACCPYCQQSEFGVTYEAPAFRRGLGYAGIGYIGTAMSSNSSLSSAAMSPASMSTMHLSVAGSGGGSGSPSPSPVQRRRTQSLSATAPNVVTTDRVRPDWASKLAAQRAQIARRAAAATALHTAAFLMGTQENRTFRGRFSRRNTSTNALAGDASPTTANTSANANTNANSSSNANTGVSQGDSGSATMEPGPRSSSGRGAPSSLAAARQRMDDLEELMFREALRQSLATEEERRRKEEKEQQKEAKRREKEERKATKAAQKQKNSEGAGRGGGSGSGSGSGSLYAAGGGSGHSSASASSLSLSGLGFGGRRRGNSAASNLRYEASASSTGAAGAGSAGSANSAAPAGLGGNHGTSSATSRAVGAVGAVGTMGSALAGTAATVVTGDKGKGVDRGQAATPEAPDSQASASASASRLAPAPQPSAGPSHLRQMSSASSVSSSLPDSMAAVAQSELQDPRSSGLSLGSRSAASDEAGEQGEQGEDRDPSASTEPMFNFSSLAELVGVQLEGKDAGRRLSAIGQDTDSKKGGDDAAVAVPAVPASKQPASLQKNDEAAEAQGKHVEHADEQSDPPEVMVTPGTPAPAADEYA